MKQDDENDDYALAEVIREPAKGVSPELIEAQAEIERAREKINVSLIALKREIADTTDWRHWIRKKPLTAMAIAFGAGFLLGRRY